MANPPELVAAIVQARWEDFLDEAGEEVDVGEEEFAAAEGALLFWDGCMHVYVFVCESGWADGVLGVSSIVPWMSGGNTRHHPHLPPPYPQPTTTPHPSNTHTNTQNV